MGHVRSAGALILGSIISSFTGSSNAQELPLRRVLLTTGGVGYFEHEATVTGDATLSLDVRLDQVSDILKSIVVVDAQGQMGRATLPGREPLAEIFRDMPFTLEDLSSPASLMRALRGSMVRMSVHASVIEGRIISVTEETTSLGEGQGTIVRHRMTLMGSTGMRQAVLEDAGSIEIVDPILRANVENALAAVAAHSATGRRMISIQAEGEGERTVSVGYVAEAPLWKATYRLVLPNSGNMAQMEGFALLENMSGHDWIGVELAVASGNPATFRQALYEAYFVTRPVVPVEVFGRILPPVDPGAVARDKAVDAPSLSRHSGVMPFAMPDGLSAAEETEAPAADTSIARATEGETAVTFMFADPIDLARGEAMLAPIIQRQMRAERVSVYRRDVGKTNPTASVRLVNESDTGLPPGAVTVYEMQGEQGDLAFVGDAQLGALPMGEERLLGFAADLEVRVNYDDKYAQVMTGASIDRGVLVVRRVERRQTDYTIAGPANEPRSMIIEHPRIAGFALVAPMQGVLGETTTHHRVSLEVAAGQTAMLEVILERPIEERMSIGGIGVEALGVFAQSAEISETVRAALRRVAELQRTLSGRQQALAALEADRTRIAADQERLRKNLEAVPAESDLGTRYLAALAETEDRIAALDQSIAAARDGVKMAKDELEQFIASLSL
ncbi:MAG: hypothetical protein IPM54_07940 [Polyangiaceae bacterium]|nr:hypothetical protein [Polyangiaceae bacterium]